MVGEGTDDGLAFSPPAIEVPPMTNVRWDWTGDGGPHNIASKGDGPVDSELIADEGSAYEHTFEETGTHLYSCKPHERLGMRDAIVVG